MVTGTPDQRLQRSRYRRAKLVVPTERGHDVLAIAQGLVPGVEQQLERIRRRQA
jgi:hypothetical protein